MKKLIVPLLAALAVSASTGLAQIGGPPNTGFDAAMTKLFGDVKAFTARCDLRVFDSGRQEKLAMPMDFSLLEGKLRTDVDMSQLKGRDMSAEQAAMLKQMGMERVISIARPDKKSLYLILPSVQACVTIAMSREDAAALETEPKMAKTVLGKETLDGHPCERRKIVLTDANGKASEATVWAATDLQDFPIQIQTSEKGDTYIFRYSKIQFAKPDAKLFELPAGYTTYDGMTAFTMGMMQKLMGGLGKP